MEGIFKVLSNLIKRIIPLFAAFVSELDVLVLSLYGRHFSMWYVLLRLFIAVMVLTVTSRLISPKTVKHRED